MSSCERMAGNPATGAPISQFDETKYIAFRVYQLGPYEWQRLYWHGTGYPGIKIGITAELTTGVSLGNPLGEKCIYFAKVTPASLHHSPQKKKKNRTLRAYGSQKRNFSKHSSEVTLHTAVAVKLSMVDVADLELSGPSWSSMPNTSLRFRRKLGGCGEYAGLTGESVRRGSWNPHHP